MAVQEFGFTFFTNTQININNDRCSSHIGVYPVGEMQIGAV